MGPESRTRSPSPLDDRPSQDGEGRDWNGNQTEVDREVMKIKSQVLGIGMVRRGPATECPAGAYHEQIEQSEPDEWKGGGGPCQPMRALRNGWTVIGWFHNENGFELW